jgi:hypothetical protein
MRTTIKGSKNKADMEYPFADTMAVHNHELNFLISIQ